MNSKQFFGAAAFAVAIFFGACQPKEDMTVTVTKSVQASAPNVNANVSDGVVTLTGTVNDEATRMAAEDAAKKISGVKSVINNITVAPAATAPVVIAPSGALQQGVVDATKDYPEVVAVVNEQGEIVVTGQVTAERWKRLKMALDALNPKRVNADSLIIK